MGEELSSNDTPNESAIRRRCGECGYALKGLGPSGRCPECGEPFEINQIVLFGWGVGHSATPANSRRNQFALYAAAFFIFLLIQFAGDFRADIPTRAIVCGIIVIGFTISWFRRRSAMLAAGAPLQVRLASWGYGDRQGVGAVRFEPWSSDLVFTVTMVAEGRHQLSLREEFFTENFRDSPVCLDKIGFEFEGSDAAADEIRIRVNEWIRGSSPRNGLDDKD